jgi:beta-N-acetylhexosaminidase
VDSHSELPVLDYSLEELRERELRPFKALIEAGIPMVMTAHVLLRKIDPENPATMSARILADLLRGELGFAGVVVADALAMKAILPQILTQRFAERVLEAQVDLLCVAGPGVDMGTAVGMAQNLCTALEANSDYQSLHQESQARVEALLARAGQYPVLELSQEVFAEHHALARRLSVNPAWSGAAKEYIPQGF